MNSKIKLMEQGIVTTYVVTPCSPRGAIISIVAISANGGLPDSDKGESPFAPTKKLLHDFLYRNAI